MRCGVPFVLALALMTSSLSVSAQKGEEGVTSQPSLQQPVSAPGAEAEVPDIETLSQRAIEHYEIQYEIPNEERKRRERKRQRGLAIGVPIAVVTVLAVVLGAVAVSRSFDDGPQP